MENQDIKVSVFCTVYNHAPYLRKCLDGFVMQKTNFKYEVLINDDASSDDSPSIILEYAEKYPNIIVPVIQKENQHSKGINITREILLPKAKGKYYAICEGDDYWSDVNKLQMQYDYMEENIECSMCVHNTIIHDLKGKDKDRLFNGWKDIHKMSEKEVFFGWKVHTSSYFMRNDVIRRPDFTKKYWFGDYMQLLWAYHKGEVVALPNVMSVYNYGNSMGMTMKNSDLQIEKYIAKNLRRIDFLKEFNEYTNYEHNDVINKRIEEIDFRALQLRQSYVLKTSKDKQEIVNSTKKICEHSYFKLFMKEKNSLSYLANLFRYKGYKVYGLWHYVMLRLEKRR